MKTFTLTFLLIIVSICFAQPKINTLADIQLKGPVKEFTYQSYAVKVKRKKIIKIENEFEPLMNSRISRFDKEGRLILWATLKEDSTPGRGTIYHFNDKGMVDQKCYFNNLNNTQKCDTIVISNEGRTIQEYSTTDTSNLVYEEWIFNKDQQVVRISKHSRLGQYDSHHFYIYPDGNDSISRQTKVGMLGSQKIHLDTLGRVTKRLNMNGDETLYDGFYYTYNEIGQLIEIIHRDDNRRKRSISSRDDAYRTVLSYDLNNNLISEQLFNEENEIESKWIHYYEGERLLADSIFNTFLSEELTLYQNTQYKYDSQGNEIESILRYYDTDWAYRVIKIRDNYGNWIREERYQDDKIERVAERKITYYED